MKEAAFNSSLVKELKKAGLYAIKLSDRFNPGIPDIYVAGGIWIECKIIKCSGRNKINVWNKLSPGQKIKLMELYRAGDTSLIVVRWELPSYTTLTLFSCQYLQKQPMIYIGGMNLEGFTTITRRIMHINQGN